MSGLKWQRAQGGRTSTAELGPIGLLAWPGNEVTYAEIGIDGAGPTIDAAEAAAEAELRRAYDALREHFDPVPVLRWERRDATFALARLGEWRLFAHPRAWSIDLDCTPVKENEPSGASLEANQRAAEAALRALGVAFRVEGA